MSHPSSLSRRSSSSRTSYGTLTLYPYTLVLSLKTVGDVSAEMDRNSAQRASAWISPAVSSVNARTHDLTRGARLRRCNASSLKPLPCPASLVYCLPPVPYPYPYPSAFHFALRLHASSPSSRDVRDATIWTHTSTVHNGRGPRLRLHALRFAPRHIGNASPMVLGHRGWRAPPDVSSGSDSVPREDI
ncbi:hypothetical protein DFH06DRAFT_169806 [Mycena polygramma]|nr:hypothetical protein DFH06DRAFT_169806 [Mycena polygramma]